MPPASTSAGTSSTAVSCHAGSGARRGPASRPGAVRSGALVTRASLPSGREPRPEPGPGPRGSAARRDLALLLDLGGLAAQVAKVVELRAPHVTAGDDLDLVDDRGVQREGPL